MADLPLFVGGPWHGRRHQVARDGETLPHVIRAPRPMPAFSILDLEGPVTSLPEPFTYELRFYRDRGGQMAFYFNADTSEYGQGAGVTSRDRAMADAILDEHEHERLPVCVVPACVEKAPLVFIASERGRLAGQDWKLGDKIRVCPAHGADIYRAQGVYGRDELAEWLRPDAMLDALDAYDAGSDLLYGSTIADRRARMLRVAISANAEASRG